MATIPDDDEAIVASPADTDVVISANARGDNLSFLEDWRPFLQPYYLIIVQAGAAESPSRPAFPVSVPQGFDYEVVTMANIISDLGSRASCIPSQASACRCAGWLFSQKRYIITLNNDCFPAKHPRKGEKVNALQQHAVNLSSPATPFFFNTLYDPFRSSCDFVRGYPFSLREGTPTVISHGLWLNVPDYDAATQLVRPSQRNLRYVDAVMTVPRGCLFPMSSLNLAFDRELIGAAMYFPPMGDSKTMGIHDDMWAGWCCKVICDHLGYGAKTGLPYVRREDTTSPFLKLKKEFTGMFRQEEIIPFFQSLRLSNAADTAEKCYLEIAQKVKAELSTLDPSFKKLATNMEVWIDLWNASNAVTPRGSSMSATSSNIAA